MQKKLSVIIPAYNEEDSLPETLTTLSETLLRENIPHEIVVVNDNSKDRTLEVLQELSSTIKELIYYTNVGPNGFGCAVRYGLERFKGDCVAIMMADLSDDPNDLVSFYNKYLEGYDCVFGTRWKKGGKVEGSGTYGIVYSSPRLPYKKNEKYNFLNRKINENNFLNNSIQKNEVSKIFFDSEKYEEVP
jgi:glycosyltransferase involved in cell wall biosynthesis